MMAMLIRYLVFLLQCSVLTIGDIQFLTSVDRFSTNGNHTNFYFHCNISGTYTLWEYNRQPLSTFSVNEVGEVKLKERDDYTYTITLLSSQPLDDNEADMGSILAITFQKGMNPDQFDVTCISNNYTSTITHQVSAANERIVDHPVVQLKYLVSGRIASRDYDSHILICTVPRQPQFVFVIDPLLSFSKHDPIGRARTIYSDDRSMAEVQGILVARDSSVSIALIVVTLNMSQVSVTCYDSLHNDSRTVPPNNQATTSEQPVGTQLITERVMMTSTNTTTDISATRETNDVKRLNIVPVVPVVLTILLTLVMAIIVIVIVLCRWKVTKAKNMNPTTPAVGGEEVESIKYNPPPPSPANPTRRSFQWNQSVMGMSNNNEFAFPNRGTVTGNMKKQDTHDDIAIEGCNNPGRG